MGLVGFWSRWELRTRWRGLVGLALLVGFGGAVALTAFAGARRTDTAIPRFVSYGLPDDGGFVFGNVLSPPVTPGAAGNSLALSPAERRVVELPQVVAHFRAPYLFMTTDPTGRTNNVGAINAIAAADPDLFRRVDRPMIITGRLPDPTRPFDVAVNELAATKRHLHVGSHVRLYAYSLAQIQSGGLTGNTSIAPQAPGGPAFRVRVAAIVRFPQDVDAVVPVAATQNVSYEGQQNLYLTPAFLRRLARGLGIPVQSVPDINLVGVRLRHGLDDWKSFAAAVPTAGRGEITVGDSGNTYGMRTAAASAQRGVHIEVIALVVFGVLAGLVTLLLVGQAIGRQAQLDRAEYETLRSLGAANRQLAATILLRAALIGVAGAAIAFGISVLASPLMPLGVARQAELHPGISIDPTVLVPGALAIVVLVVGIAALPAWRVQRRTGGARGDNEVHASSTRLGRVLARSSAPPATTIGIRYALERGRGRSAVPVATAMISAVLAVGVLAGALTFGASLDHLVNSPRQQGWNWNVLVGNPHDLTDREAQGAALLARNHLVGSYSAIAILAGAGQGNASIGSVPLDTLIAIDPLKGAAHPPLLEGRAPRRPDEIVLGDDTLDQLHRRVGETVRTPTPAGQLTLHIVGRMIAPSIGDLFTNHLGDGGWVSGALARQISARAPSDPNGLPPTVFTLFAVRYAPGVAPDRAFASLERDFGPTVLRPLPAEDVVNLHTVNHLPMILAGLVALLGTATLANTLVSAVRRRRRDLAILKTIGFVRRQVGALIAWQATTFSIVALVVGIPLGIAAGRWTWNLVASGIGSVSPPIVPIALVLLSIPATLAVANLVAVLPGRNAARVAPATVMRNQ